MPHCPKKAVLKKNDIDKFSYLVSCIKRFLFSFPYKFDVNNFFCTPFKCICPGKVPLLHLTQLPVVSAIQNMNHKYIERNFFQRTLTFLFHIGQIILNLTNIGTIRFAKVITKWIPLSVVVEWCQYSFLNYAVKKLFNAKWLYFVIIGKTIVQHTFSAKLLIL